MSVELDALGDVVARGEYGAAPAGRHEFTSAEAQNSGVPPGARNAPVNARSGRLGRIFDDSHRMLAGDSQDFGHIDDPAVQMGDDNRFGLGAQTFHNAGRIEVPVVVADVDEDRGRAHRQDILKIRLVVVRRQDHFIARPDPQAAQGQFDGCRPARTRNNVGSLVKLCQQTGQAGDMRTMILSPRSICQGPVEGGVDLGIGKRPIGGTGRTHRVTFIGPKSSVSS